MWAPRGRYPRLPSWDHHGKWVVYGSLEVRRGRLHHQTCSRWDQRALLRFLRRVLRRYHRQRVLLVWDRASIHRAAKVRPWLEQQQQVEVFDLPAYCADLDPLEDFWGLLRRQVTDNHMFAELAGLRRAISQFCRSWQGRGEELLWRLQIDPQAPQIRLQSELTAPVNINGLRFSPA